MTAGQGYHLYVVELDASVPRAKALQPCTTDPQATPVYVGQSWYPPEVRRELHLLDIHASRWVREFGLHLRPDLVDEPRWVRTHAQSLRRERELAHELRRRGYVVFGGH